MAQKSILDAFSRIKSDSDAKVPDLCINLINHLFRHAQPSDEINDDGIPKEITYTLKRLIQGLGSSKTCVRTCYFSSLSVLLTNLHYVFNGKIELDYLKSIVDDRLSKYDSKREEGEVLVGQVLTYGASIRSGLFMKAPTELQQEILKLLLERAKEKSYLPLLVYTFIFEYMDKVEKQTIKSVLWPILKHHLHDSLEKQTFESLACLLKIYQMYSSLLKGMPILMTLCTPDVYDMNTIFNMLTDITWAPCLKHPVYDGFVNYVVSHNKKRDLLRNFWNLNTDTVLKRSRNRLQNLAIFKLLNLFLIRVDFDMIDSLLTPTVVNWLLGYSEGPDKMVDDVKLVFNSLLKRCSDEGKDYPSTVFSILCKLTFDVYNILIDKDIGLKIVSPLVAALDEPHVIVLSDRLEEVINQWNATSKRYAVHLLARLLSHNKVHNIEWRTEKLKFLLTNSLFYPIDENKNISNELAATMKSSVFNSLNHRIPNVHLFRKVLLNLVQCLDNMLRVKSNRLRTPLQDDALMSWKQFVAVANKVDVAINKQTSKQQEIMAVFHVLFLQMILYLFSNYDLARDALLELEKCYERVKKPTKKRLSSGVLKKDDNTIDEPVWIEVLVELFLSWLSRDTSFFRHLISRIFPYLCSTLTAQAVYQMLEVLDPNNSDLLSSEDKNGDVDDTDDDDEEVNEETDSEFEKDEDDIEETAMDKMRAAVHQALGTCGPVTDTESVDLDDIGEQEGKKMDDALSAAFKSFDKNKTKKKIQSFTEKILMNFRIRVLDLLEIILENNPPLTTVLEMMPVLFSLLEFCVKNHHQKPLEERVRAVLRKIGSLKKYSALDDVNNQLIVVSLNNLFDKGTRTNAIFRDISSHISECCLFLVKAFISKRTDEVNGESTDNNSVDSLFRVCESALDKFFNKRDYMLPPTLFEHLLTKVPMKETIRLYYKIVDYAFDSSVRLFKRRQALAFLLSLYKNPSTLKIFSDGDKNLLEKKLSGKIITMSDDKGENKDCSIKENFQAALLDLLLTIKNNKNGGSGMKWNKIAVLLAELSITSSTRNIYRRLCSALDVRI